MAPKLSTLRELSAGDVIIDAKPVIHIVANEMKGNNCDNCLTKCNDLKKCSKCLQMYYCDKDCQRIDWKYHKIECKLFRKNKFRAKNSSDEERVLIRLLLAMKSDDTFATKRYKLFDGSDVCLNDIEVDCKALSENPLQTTIFGEIMAHFKIYGLDFDRKVLLRWFGVISCSHICLRMTSFAEKMVIDECEGIDPKDLKELTRFEITPDVGFGLFPEMWSVGHSCVPNATLVPNGLTLQLKALKPIAVGTEITMSYVMVAQNKTDRQIDLRIGHLINCHCLKCERNLDWNIDYRKYFESYNKLQTIMSEIEIEVQQLVTKPKRYELRKYVPLFEKIKNFEKQVFGEFSLKYSETLLKIRLIARFAAESCGKPWDQTYEQELEDNFRVVFGVDHPSYKKYSSRNGSGTPLAEAGRMVRDQIRSGKF